MVFIYWLAVQIKYTCACTSQKSVAVGYSMGIYRSRHCICRYSCLFRHKWNCKV